MNIEFRKAIIPDELPALCEFDKKAFHAHPADLFSEDDWKQYESWWMTLDGITVGCIALQTDTKDELWISSTGLLPEFCGRGLGNRIKQWEIDYAKSNGYSLIGTMMRESNERIIGLNKKFGFSVLTIVESAYSGPDEAGIVMVLHLS